MSSFFLSALLASLARIRIAFTGIAHACKLVGREALAHLVPVSGHRSRVQLLYTFVGIARSRRTVLPGLAHACIVCGVAALARASLAHVPPLRQYLAHDLGLKGIARIWRVGLWVSLAHARLQFAGIARACRQARASLGVVS